MKTSNKGILLIKNYEGCRLTSYKCPAGKLTIGFGHTGTDVKANMTITQNKADELLKKDLTKFEKGVEKLVTVELTQGQFDALVSFSYNLGLANLKSSTLLKYVNAKKFSLAAEEFKKWIYANHKILPGLVKRRNAEKALFLSY